ncbi:MAG: hypothetical protein IJ242_09885 [Clostridia bacterium]|nr:hypothetical protein [Clostridia bacterium]
MTPAETWWRRIPAGERMVAKVCDDLLDGRSVQIFPDMVWKEAFLEEVFAEVRNTDPSVMDVSFDGADMEPGARLLDIIADRLGFAFNFDGSLETLVHQLQVVNSSHIWHMSNLSGRHLKELYGLIADIARRKAHISIVLEDAAQTQTKALYQIRMNPTPLDAHYFAWTLLMEQDDVPLLEYAAILCEELSGGDLPRCAYLCSQIHEVLQHPGELCDWASGEMVQQTVHLAQIRGILPMIEKQRLMFIDRLKKRINRILPFSDEYGNTFTQPHEVELRHLVHFRYELLLTEEESALLSYLYEARNELAHLRILQEDEIRQLSQTIPET